MYIYIYIYTYIYIYSPNKDFSQGRGSYFASIVIPWNPGIAGRQPGCLSLGASAQLPIAWIPGLLVGRLGA